MRHALTLVMTCAIGLSRILSNPADDHSKNVFDPSVRDHTDQFLYRFRKPR